MKRALQDIVIEHLTVTRVVAGLRVSWSAANTAVHAEDKRRLAEAHAASTGDHDRCQRACLASHPVRENCVTMVIDVTPPARRLGQPRGWT
ncbi:hypothetical protein FCK90_11185 [Kocuria coralli]|uniref:Uncharacterized protein n=1 Tax=Kocuria coralli TaxID=1461025 RepID=A0A5J5KVR6_9MICC|nr:hypothetical protein FCK90_11185 [Kocuria coralli]